MTRSPRRPLAALTALTVTAALTTLLGPSPASAAPTGAITGAGSGRCLDVEGVRRSPGAPTILWDCHGNANQRWTLTSAGALTVYDPASCLTASGPGKGARVTISRCDADPDQHWTLRGDGTITVGSSGLCLDASGRGTTNLTPVIVWTCNGQDNQRWTSSLRTDTSPPSAPGPPTVSAVTCTTARMTWQAATDDLGVTAYDLYHDGQFLRSVGGSTLSATVDVVAGARWGLYVNARDAAGNVSQASGTTYVTPPACQNDTTPPTSPTGLSATVAGTSVTLSWTASKDNTGVVAYDVLRDGATIGTGATTTLTDSGLVARTGYSYAVVARDAQGNVSPRSIAATVTTGAACSTPVCGVEKVADDLDIPWGLLTLPDGSVLYSRRDAYDLVRLDPRTGVKTTVGTVPGVASTDGEGGLLGLAISPQFSTDRWLYVMHTSPTDNRIVRFRFDGTLQPQTEQVLVTGIQRQKFHDGGRLRFGPDDMLYASTGDAQDKQSAQDTTTLNGKILRLTPDGRVPSDNPFGNYVWSYGHRNPQGIDFDSQGRLWEQEFGDSIMDETNLIVKGGNYGWPACEGTSGDCGRPGFLAPKRTYPTSEGSCSGLAVVRDVVYIACARGERMYRAVISGSSLTNVQQFFVGTYGRLRTVEPAPGGGLWLTTTNGGDKDSTASNSTNRIFRVTLGE